MELKPFFLSTNWINILAGKSIDENVQVFYSVLEQGVKSHVLKVKIKNKRYPLHFSKETTKYIKLKNEMHNKFEIYG